jgi:hypothetical protein
MGNQSNGARTSRGARGKCNHSAQAAGGVLLPPLPPPTPPSRVFIFTKRKQRWIKKQNKIKVGSTCSLFDAVAPSPALPPYPSGRVMILYLLYSYQPTERRSNSIGLRSLSTLPGILRYIEQFKSMLQIFNPSGALSPKPSLHRTTCCRVESSRRVTCFVFYLCCLLGD